MFQDHLENYGSNLDNNSHTVIEAQEMKPDGFAEESILFYFFAFIAFWH